MTSSELSKGIVGAVLKLAFLAIFLLFLYQIKLVLVFLIISLIVTLIGNPIVIFLKNKLKFKNTTAVIVTLLIFLGFILGFILLFIPLILKQSESLSLLDTKAIEKNMNDIIVQADTYFKLHNVDLMNLIKKSNITSNLNFDFLPSILNSLFGFIGNFGMGLASVLFISFFFLKDRLLFDYMFRKLIPDDHEEKILHSVDKIKNLLSRYFIGILIQLSVVFVLYFIVLIIFGVKSAFIIALLCAILNIIPYIGPLIGTGLAVILTMIGLIGQDFRTEVLPTAIYVLIGFTIVQMIDNNLSQPYIFSNSIKSHPLEIFLITLISGFLLGITGMIIAIPTYTVLKVIGKEFLPENKIIKFLTKDI